MTYPADFWNKRYSLPDFVYGQEPNLFFKTVLQDLSPGIALFPAEGEGRNAVYAAKSGWKVFAFDQSEEGQKKALQLAEANGVKIDYIVSELAGIPPYTSDVFDALVLIYAHFPDSKRQEYHRQLASLVRSGGMLILECFGRKQLENQRINPGASGPRDPSMLTDLETLKSDFAEFDLELSEERDIDLDEGSFHTGRASVIRLVGKKR